MNELYWRAVFDDGSTWEWEQDVEVEPGRRKRASIDDVPRERLANLLTVDHTGRVLHSVGFPPGERATRRAVWRLNRRITPGGGGPVTVGALSGYNLLEPDGSSSLMLDLVLPPRVDPETGSLLEPEVESGEGYGCELHPREVFSEEESRSIQERLDDQNRMTEEDNELLANPITDDNGPTDSL